MELEHTKKLLSNFHLNYPSKLGPLQLWKCFHFTFSPLPLCTYIVKKKKRFWVLIHILECSFLCTNLLTCILPHSFRCNLMLVFRSSLHYRKFVYLYSAPQSSLAIIQYLYFCFIIYHHLQLFSTHRNRKNNIHQNKKKNITKLWCRQSMWPERNYYCPLLHPPFYFPLSALLLLPPPLLCLSSSPSVFPFPCCPTPPSPLPWTQAMNIALPQNSDFLFQPTSLKPPQSSRCPFSISVTHSDPPTSLTPLSSTLCPFVALFFLL